MQNRPLDRPPQAAISIARGLWLAPLLLTLLLLAGSLRANPEDEAVPDLAGIWKLDVHMSDDPLEQLEEARRQQRREEGSAGFIAGATTEDGVFIGSKSSNRRSQDRRTSVSPATIQQRASELTRGSSTLTITHDDPRLSVRRADGRFDEYVTDGKKAKVGRPPHQHQVKAKWEGHRLIIVTKLDDRGGLTEIYGLVAEGEYLQVVVRVADRSSGQVEIRRIYRREKP